MEQPAIEVRDLWKSFGEVQALAGLDLTVQTGEIAGFLGPNGAGKSTAIRVLLGVLRADAGTARVLGGDARADAAALHGRLAYVPGDVSLWPMLTGGEAIDVLTRLRGADARDPALRRRRADLLERFHLDPGRRCRTYSKGNRQKVALVAALTAPAELYLFDEPTSGLDPLMEHVFQELVRERAATGTAVLLSSHILGEVEHLCDSVTIIRDGRTIEAGALAELRHLARVHLHATLPVDTSALAAELAARPGVHNLVAAAGRLSCAVDHPSLAGVLGHLAAAGVTDLSSAPPSLEDLFLGHYGAPGR